MSAAFVRLLEENIDNLPPGTISETTVLASLPQWDSLAILTTIAVVQERYGKTLTGKQIAACVSVADLAKLAEAS